MPGRAPPRRAWFGRVGGASRAFVLAAAGLLGAMVALVASSSDLVYKVRPDLKPDPRERIGAELKILAVEPKMRLNVWLAEAHPRDTKAQLERIFGGHLPQSTELTQEGEIVYVLTKVDGFKHRAVKLRVRLYNARKQRRTPKDFQRVFRETSSVAIDAPSRSSVQLLFIPDLTDEPTARFLRVRLVDSSSGEVLALTDSPKLVSGKLSDR